MHLGAATGIPYRIRNRAGVARSRPVSGLRMQEVSGYFVTFSSEMPDGFFASFAVTVTRT